MSWGYYPKKPTVAEQRARAKRQLSKLQKGGRGPRPVEVSGRKIATTFWGKAWCDNLERYSDYANRLPRGRSYVRNGSVLDLQITEGQVEATVSGTRVYRVTLAIEPVSEARWAAVRAACAGGVGSLVELLQGRLSQGVMEIVTRKGAGLFPSPDEISLSCTCPDWATMCKHVAATLYAVGARLDQEPEVLFGLRGVDPGDLVHEAIDEGVSRRRGRGPVLDTADLASVFGIDIDFGDDAPAAAPPAKRGRGSAEVKRDAGPKRKPAAGTKPGGAAKAKQGAGPTRKRAAGTKPGGAAKAKGGAAAKGRGRPAAVAASLSDRARALLDAIEASPGLRGPQLAEALGVSRSSIANYVAELKEHGLVRFVGAPRTGGYHPISVAPAPTPPPRPPGLSRRAGELLDAVGANPGLRTPRLAQILGVSWGTIAEYVAELKERDLIRFVGTPRTGGYYPAG